MTSGRDVAQRSRRPRMTPRGSCKRRLGRGRRPASPRVGTHGPARPPQGYAKRGKYGGGLRQGRA
eukprot:13005771-Heterocapsa_arctica.AAC.1